MQEVSIDHQHYWFELITTLTIVGYSSLPKLVS